MLPTNYIVNVKDQGLIIAMLLDKNGGRPHTVGINLMLKLIYDCQEILFWNYQGTIFLYVAVL